MIITCINIILYFIYLDVSSDKPAPQKVPRIHVETFSSLRVFIIGSYLLLSNLDLLLLYFKKEKQKMTELQHYDNYKSED